MCVYSPPPELEQRHLAVSVSRRVLLTDREETAGVTVVRKIMASRDCAAVRRFTDSTGNF